MISAPTAPAAAASNAVKADRASPPANRTSASRASAANVQRSASPAGATSARSISVPTSVSPSRANRTTMERDSSGEITENEGFSVVAATNVIHPFSTAGNNASCCVLENRCTSSMNNTVRRPVMRPSRAPDTTSRTSRTPADTADNSIKRRPGPAASNVAMVVFPDPGGPHRITDESDAGVSADSSRSRRNGAPGASTSS